MIDKARKANINDLHDAILGVMRVLKKLGWEKPELRRASLAVTNAIIDSRNDTQSERVKGKGKCA